MPNASQTRLPAVLQSWYVWGILVFWTVVCGTLMLLYALTVMVADRQRYIGHTIAMMWGRAIFLSWPCVRIAVVGRRHLPSHRPVILVVNHQSLVDIVALLCLPYQFKFVAKSSLFQVPFLGWSMALAGYVRLARGRHGSIRETYQDAKRWLAKGISVCFFPEGTRSRTNELLPFHNGAFKLALETRTPLVPIAIRGTRDLLPRGTWLVGERGRVRVTVLAPIEPAHFPASPEQLRDEVKHLIEQALQNSPQSIAHSP